MSSSKLLEERIEENIQRQKDHFARHQSLLNAIKSDIFLSEEFVTSFRNIEPARIRYAHVFTSDASIHRRETEEVTSGRVHVKDPKNDVTLSF